jgi:hypothetical protein
MITEIWRTMGLKRSTFPRLFACCLSKSCRFPLIFVISGWTSSQKYAHLANGASICLISFFFFRLRSHNAPVKDRFRWFIVPLLKSSVFSDLRSLPKKSNILPSNPWWTGNNWTQGKSDSSGSGIRAAKSTISLQTGQITEDCARLTQGWLWAYRHKILGFPDCIVISTESSDKSRS